MPLINMNLVEGFPYDNKRNIAPFSIFFIRLRKNSVQEMFTKTDRMAVSFVKAGAVPVTLYFRS
jgi:hypothetical protein